MARTIDVPRNLVAASWGRWLINPVDPMDKSDPYGEWVLFGTKQEPGGPPLAVDEELLAVAREAWPHVLAHVRGELFDRELGPERTSLAADIWDRVLLSVAKTRQRNKGHRPPISDLQSYLIGVFHHRFNRLLRQEQRRVETIELVSSVLDLERFEAALDTGWAEQLERSITVRQITDRMDAWTKKVWEARQYEYSWKEIAGWFGITEQQAKMKFRYNLEKIRQNIVRSLKRKTLKNSG
jgi:DNA-directed RNA polymerase specialized sigma24 family protein